MSDSGTDGGSNEREVRLARYFVQLADTLVDDFDVVELFTRLTDACVDMLHTTAAGLLLVDQRGGLQLVASSSEEMRLLELFQLQEEEGPCLDSISTGRPVWVDDVHAEPRRWPRFAAAAGDQGFRSVCALPLRLRSEVIGSLNMFSSDGFTMTVVDRELAQGLADVATIAVLQQRSAYRSSLLAEQLQVALNSRVVIEQAKGVLAEHSQAGMQASFLGLRRYARSHNLRLGDVATAVVTGSLSPAEVLPSGVRR